MNIDNKTKKEKKIRKTVRRDDDDDDSSKKPTALSSLTVLANSPTQDQKKSSKCIASKKRLPSVTNSWQTSTSHSSNNCNHYEISQGNVGHHSDMVTAQGGLFQEKQMIADRQVIVSTTKQQAFDEEVTVEETIPGIYNNMVTGTIPFEKRGIIKGSFAKGVPEDEVTPGTNDDEIKGSNKLDKKTIMDASNKHNIDMKLAIMPMAHKSHPLKLHSVQSHEPMVSYQQEEPAHHGALAIAQTGSAESILSTPNDNTISVQYERQHQLLVSKGNSDIEAHEPTLNAVPVSEDSGVLASVTLIDTDTERNSHQQHQIRTIVGILIIGSIIAVAVAVPVVLTCPGPSAATFSPSSSPIPSATPSFLLTARPSIHPSWGPSSSPSSGLLGFLVANSFDSGMTLAIAGSSQLRAMDWLSEVSGLSELNYYLLQTYALVTLYFETNGNQWISELAFAERRLDLGSSPNMDSEYKGEWLNITPSVNPNGFCDWQGVLCNDNREIESLTLSSNHVYGSLPAEIGMLHQSLSKFTILLA